MEFNGVEIEDTFAEAFESWYSRFLITAMNKKWAKTAATEVTGYATSMIGCSAEAAIESYVPPSETPDGRPGYVVQLHTSKKKMEMELVERIGQCVLTAPTTSVFAYGSAEEKLDTGFKMKFFGDGFEEERELYGRKVSAIPVMMGEFLIEKELVIGKGVAGGNIIIMARNQPGALAAAEAAVEAIEAIEGAITPFPGGVVASGSKVGSSKYSFMKATTNEKYCPTLKGQVDSALSDAEAAAEVVIDATNEDVVRKAMKAATQSATRVQGVLKVTAGNYGGNLGKVHVYLKDLI